MAHFGPAVCRQLSSNGPTPPPAAGAARADGRCAGGAESAESSPESAEFRLRSGPAETPGRPTHGGGHRASLYAAKTEGKKTLW